MLCNLISFVFELCDIGDEWKSGGPSPAVQTLFTLRGAQDVVDTVRLKLDRNITLDEAEDLLSEWRKEFLKVSGFSWCVRMGIICIPS